VYLSVTTGIRLLKMYQMQDIKMLYNKFIQVKEIYKGGRSFLMVGYIVICQN